MIKLKELRKKNRITMGKLGHEVGVAESTVSAYESGRREPDLTTLIKMADFFGVSLDYLVGRTNDGRRLIVQELQLDDEVTRPNVMRLALQCDKLLNDEGVAAMFGYFSRLLECDEFKLDVDLV